jgi:hypothetical protein
MCQRHADSSRDRCSFMPLSVTPRTANIARTMSIHTHVSSSQYHVSQACGQAFGQGCCIRYILTWPVHSSTSRVTSAAALASEVSDPAVVGPSSTDGGCSEFGEATTPAGGTKVSPSSVSSCMRKVSQISISWTFVSTRDQQQWCTLCLPLSAPPRHFLDMSPPQT